MENSGSTAQLKCNSSSPVSWTKDNQPQLKNKSVINFNELILPSLEGEDTGTYTCHGTTDDNITFEAKSLVLVVGINIHYLSIIPFCCHKVHRIIKKKGKVLCYNLYFLSVVSWTTLHITIILILRGEEVRYAQNM